jgi:hypothetical protein
MTSGVLARSLKSPAEMDWGRSRYGWVDLDVAIDSRLSVQSVT